VNPFDLRGPEFLLFYVVLALLTFAALFVWQRLSGPRPSGDRLLRDPYLVAGLRGGGGEIVQVAAFSLLAQGVVACPKGREIHYREGASAASLDPVERAVVEALRGRPRRLSQLQKEPAIEAAVRPHLETLESAGLLLSNRQKRARVGVAWMAAGFLAVVAAIKLIVAFHRGRTNVLFLILLAVLCVWGCTAWARARPRTAEGVRVLADLRALFGPRRARCPSAPSPGGSSDLVLLAAVSGIVGEPFGHQAAQRARRASASSGCSSSCGAGASGSSCGGSCGGGCGGCGS